MSRYYNQRTLHEFVVPGVCEFPVTAVRIETSEIDDFLLTFLEADQVTKTLQELDVARRPTHVRQDRYLVIRLPGRTFRVTRQC